MLAQIRSQSPRCWIVLCIAVFSVLALVAQAQPHSAKVIGVEVTRTAGHTRLTLELSGPVEHSLLTLSNPDRLVIDIKNCKLQSKSLLSQVKLSSSTIKLIRSGVKDKSDLRIVLDLGTKVKPRSFLQRGHGKEGDRLIIELYDQQTATTSAKRPTSRRSRRRPSQSSAASTS